MSPEPWFYVLLIGIGGLHLLVALLVLRFESGRTTAHARRVETADDETSGDHVTCGECGATNETGYRYCRQCVSELPGMVTASQSTPATAGRELF
ncbi:MAG: hypothetical protein ABEH65_07325 [Halobacteriales archaeon]